MQCKLKRLKNKKVDISLTCEHCGQPINQTSVIFGMDCKNHCAEKQAKKDIKALLGFAKWLGVKKF